VFNVCPKCGEYSVEKTVDPAGPFAICPFCHHAHPFLQQPLFVITGSSGAGKTTVCLELVSLMNDCVVMDSDILWGAFPATPLLGRVGISTISGILEARFVNEVPSEKY
jgi:hypothetical protein